MKTEKPASVIRPTDDEARSLARRLISTARFGAIGVLDPQSGHPYSSRVLVGTDIDGVPVMLSSTLALHTQAVLADPRCSLLVGEPGKGDPLAWPRLSLRAMAERIKPDTESHSRIRDRFVLRHPKARLYVDFADFCFFRLVPESASLNGGFGKAYNILSDDLRISRVLSLESISQGLQILDELNARENCTADSLIKHFFNEKTENWSIIGLDGAGLDLARKEQILRLDWRVPITDSNGMIEEYLKLLKEAYRI